MRIQSMTNRIMMFILAFALILPGVFFPVEGFAKSAYAVIDGKIFDVASSVPGDGRAEVGKNSAGAQVFNGGCLVYKKIDFTDESPLTVTMNVASTPINAKTVEVRIDSKTSDPIAIVNIVDPIDFQTCITYTTPLLTKVTGVHDLYISPGNSSFVIQDFQFMGEQPEENTYRPYVGGSPFADVTDEGLLRDIDLLTQLGMFKSDDPEFGEEMPVTRAEFAQSVYGIFVDTTLTEEEKKDGRDDSLKFSATFSDVSYKHENADAISYLGGRGIMNGTAPDIFEPDSFISERDAVVVLVRALGYSQMAESEGGYPNGYLKVASKKEIVRTAVKDDMLRHTALINLLMDAIEADVMVPYGIIENYTKYTTIDGILEDTRSIYGGQGVVEANSYSTLGIPDSDIGINSVKINGVKYKIGKTNATGLLGIECDFYYQEKDGIKTIKGIVPSAATEITEILSSKDGIISIKNDKIIYTPYGKTDEEIIYIEKDARLIYNGLAAEDSLEAMLDYKDSFVGKIRVVENGDKTQTIIVEEYQDYTILAVSPDHTSLDVEGGTGKVSWKATDNLFILDEAGEEMPVGKLGMGDVVTIYASKNSGKRLIRMFRSNNSVEGRVTKLENGDIYVNDVKYQISNHGKTPQIGQEGRFILNIYGDIIKVTEKDPSIWKTGIFMGAKISDSGFSKSAEIKIITTSGAEVIYPIANRLLADGVSISDEIKQIDGEAYSFCGIANMEAEEVIRYRVNSDNKIFAIDTYREVKKDNNDVLLKIHPDANGELANASFVYMKQNCTLWLMPMSGKDDSTGMTKFYAPAESLVFSFFGDEHKAANCTIDSIGNVLNSANYSFKGSIYSTVGDATEANILVWDDSSWKSDKGQCFVYSHKGTGVNAEGDIVDLIYGWENGGLVTYTVDKSGSSYCADSVDYLLKAKPGDMFDVYLNGTTAIRVTRIPFLQGAETEREGMLKPVLSKEKYEDGEKTDSRYSWGKVVKKTENYTVIQIGASKQEVIYNKLGKVCVVEKRADNGEYIVESGTAANISVGDTVFAYITGARTHTVVVYKDIKL